MPVRIIFRGLILFELRNDGTLVAELINKPEIKRRPEKETKSKPPGGPHEHRHDARIQIATDDETRSVLRPVDLAQGEDINIVLANQPVTTGPEFFDHVPRLGEVISAASIGGLKHPPTGTPDDRLVRNTITVRGGELRVRNVVMWDHGAFPLSGNLRDRGRYTASHVPLKFVGSRWQGHMASEFVVEHWDVSSVDLTAAGNLSKDKFVELGPGEALPQDKFPKKPNATGKVSHRVPYDTVEILITNYEVQEHKAVPWGLDFQWLFERVGYAPVDLSADFGLFERLGRAFDSGIYDNDRRLLLEPRPGVNNFDDNTVGLPFPYVPPDVALGTLKKLESSSDKPTPRAPLTKNEEEDRPICVGGFK